MQKFLSIVLLSCVALAQTQNQIDFGAEDREEQDRLQACLFFTSVSDFNSSRFAKKYVYEINLQARNVYIKTNVVPALIGLEIFSRPKAPKILQE